MDRRKESLSDIKLCRFCLTQDSSLTSLYDRSRDPILVNLPLKIMACVSIEVFPSDKMPSYICERCRAFMDICYDFKQICRRADESCLQFVQNGIPVSAVTWPLSLTKIFNLAQKVRPINTVVEGGATIQVTSQDMSENEEDEDRYNIKIDAGGDGSKGTTCIKVTSGEKESATQKKAGFSTVSKLSRHVRAHAGDRAYPCKYCNKSFMKSHHYTRHLRLKHEEQARLARGVDAEFRCEQCGESFGTQDDLYYHSAIHATQNLICPLCQEKFENVDAVTAHIRTHVNGIEFMCEYCELVFTSKEKLDAHMTAAHEDELTPRQELGLDESSLEADACDADADVDADDDDEDNGLNVKEEDDHMVVEIKKADGYMLRKDIEVGQATNTNSEDSEMEAIYTELSTVDTLALARAGGSQAPVATKSEATSSKASKAAKASNRIGILRKAEAIKRKAAQKDTLEVPQKKERPAKVDSTTPTTILTTHQLSSDKSLRLLEKELQELTRTPWRSDGKSMRFGEARRKQPVHTSTPKLRSADEKKALISKAPAVAEKKPTERRPPTKDNKDTKESKEARNTVTSTKDDKSVSSTKDDKPAAYDKEDKPASKEDKKTCSAKEDEAAVDKQAKVTSAQENKNNAKAEKATYRESRAKATPKDVPSASSKADAPSTSTAREDKRGAPDKDDKNTKEDPEALKNGDTITIDSSEENVVRRSTRPSKIKNYANMIRDRTRIIRDEHDDEDLSDDEPDTEKEADQLQASTPVPTAARRRSVPKRKPAPAPPAADRRRGRPRKETSTIDATEEEEDDESQTDKVGSNSKPEETKDKAEEPAGKKEAPAVSQNTATSATSPTSNEAQPPLTNMLVSPTGQTLKKVPIKALPPGIKPLPLPINARSGDLCHMQIGKKMVKVQKIVMTKAEVEAMAKKGLLEMKDGTMVLKQGIKLPGSDPAALRSGIVSPGAVRKVSATPTRCNFDGDDA